MLAWKLGHPWRANVVVWDVLIHVQVLPRAWGFVFVCLSCLLCNCGIFPICYLGAPNDSNIFQLQVLYLDSIQQRQLLIQGAWTLTIFGRIDLYSLFWSTPKWRSPHADKCFKMVGQYTHFNRPVIWQVPGAGHPIWGSSSGHRHQIKRDTQDTCRTAWPC